ncbi:MAG: signal peptidase I [Pseudomonadota bacterium]
MDGTRNRWLASFLSLVFLGLGQIYCGRLRRGLIFVLIETLALLICRVSVRAVSTAAFLNLFYLAVVLGIATRLVCALDGFLLARQTGSGFQPQWFNRIRYYFLFIVLLLVANQLLVVYPALKTYWIPTTTMAPAILPGDWILADARHDIRDVPGSIHRGDVVTFPRGADNPKIFVKRVVGLPGDNITIDGTSVRVNGRELQHPIEKRGKQSFMIDSLAPYQFFRERGDRVTYEVVWSTKLRAERKEFTVKPQAVFLMGDDRSNSVDSRIFGDVPIADLLARVRVIFFSWSDGGIRWNRIGTPLDE